jgi:hypothetical protein
VTESDKRASLLRRGRNWFCRRSLRCLSGDSKSEGSQQLRDDNEKEFSVSVSVSVSVSKQNFRFFSVSNNRGRNYDDCRVIGVIDSSTYSATSLARRREGALSTFSQQVE